MRDATPKSWLSIHGHGNNYPSSPRYIPFNSLGLASSGCMTNVDCAKNLNVTQLNDERRVQLTCQLQQSGENNLLLTDTRQCLVKISGRGRSKSPPLSAQTREELILGKKENQKPVRQKINTLYRPRQLQR